MASEIEFLGLSAEEAESVADESLSGGLYVKILKRSAAGLGESKRFYRFTTDYLAFA
jgi:hypothetical protein